MLAGYVAKYLQVRIILQNTEGQFIKESNIPCGQCGKQYTSQGSFAQHRRAVHEGIKFPFGQCGKQYTNSKKVYISRHI